MTSTQNGELVDLAGIETKIDAVDTVVDGIDTIIDDLHDTDIPAIQTVVDDLHDTDLPAVLAEVEYVEHHLHGSNLTYGKAGATPLIMERSSTVPLTVEGGDNAWGVEPLLCKGTLDGAYFDPGKIQVSAVDTANSPTVLQFYYGTLGAGVACTVEADDDIVTAAGHGCIDGDRVIFDTLDDETKGVDRNTVYYVRDMSGDGFKVESTSGGGAINITGDLVGTIKKITTPTFATEIVVSMAALNADAAPFTFPCLKIASTAAFWCRAKSKSGDTTLVSFFIDLHTYVA